MKDQIKKLEVQLKELKEAYEREQTLQYEASDHKHFEKGDVVGNGTRVVVVEWTENKGIGCEYEKGYFGGSIVSGDGGFGTFKRDEFSLVEDKYYTSCHKIKLNLTGIEIESLKRSLGYKNMNPSKTKSKVLDILDAVHK